jgi:hypothetical protein
LGARACSVKTPRQNDVSSVRPRSDGLQIQQDGSEDASEMDDLVVGCTGSLTNLCDNFRPAAIESPATFG